MKFHHPSHMKSHHRPNMQVYPTRLSRRGQITIFIILAIIILFSLALYFYVQSSATKVRPPIEQLEVSDEVKPIQVYVTQCLSQVSKNALITLGNNGGYIDSAHMPGMRISPQAYTSDALIFSPQIIPYWYYLKDDCVNPSSPFGCLETRKPALCENNVKCILPSAQGDGSMEKQLNSFIESHINECIAGFAPFKDQFDITAGTLKVDSQINDHDVSFKLDYPLIIQPQRTKKTIKIPYFYTKHDVALKDLYLFATDIYIAEMNSTFIERVTLNLISVYSGINEGLLPPMSGVQFMVVEKKYWIRSQVKEQLQNDVLPYVNMIQIVNAQNAKSISPGGTDEKYLPFEEGFYKSMLVKVSDTSYSPLRANILYPYTDIYFKIGDSEIIKPASIDPGDNQILKMAQFFMNDYRFKYDLSYPVMIKLTDPQAFNGEGYSFTIALEANIRQNVPVTGNITVVQYGNGTRGVELDSVIQKPNRTIIIETSDKHTQKPLDGVIISYRCGPQYSIGTTQMSAKKAVLKDRMPFCQFGGEIIYEKPGYMGSSIPFNNDEGVDTRLFKLALWPIVEKQVKIYKRTPMQVAKIRGMGAGAIAYYNQAVTPIGDSDSVFVSFNRFKEQTGDEDVPLVGFLMYTQKNQTLVGSSITSQASKIYEYYAQGAINESVRNELEAQLSLLKNQSSTEDDQSLTIGKLETYNLSIVPGTYLYDAFIVSNKPITIPKDVRSFCTIPEVLGVCIPGRTEIVLNETKFDAWITGGARLNVVLTENDVYENSILVLYVLEMPVPNSWKMIEEAQTPEDYQQGKTFLLRPSYE
ncbi:MAG: hypothetical protein WC916_02050 [Candidatus Woesearchaeota archaeon]